MATNVKDLTLEQLLEIKKILEKDMDTVNKEIRSRIYG